MSYLSFSHKEIDVLIHRVLIGTKTWYIMHGCNYHFRVIKRILREMYEVMISLDNKVSLFCLRGPLRAEWAEYATFLGFLLSLNFRSAYNN